MKTDFRYHFLDIFKSQICCSKYLSEKLWGEKSSKIFSDVHNHIKLELFKKEILENEYVWLVYEVEDGSEE